jgi:hypothetical protein
MSTASSLLPMAVRGVARWRRTAGMSALARIEGRRLLCHPVFLTGLVLSLLYFIRAREGMVAVFAGGACWGFFPLAGGTLIAAGLAATRSRRDGTEELYESLPHPRSTRTTGQLLGLLCTLPVCGVLIAAAYLSDALFFTHVIAVAGHTPTVVELAYGPSMVLAFGAVGIVLARVTPTSIAGPLMIVAIFQAQPADGGSGWGAWLLPLWNDMVVESGVSVPCESGNGVPGCGPVVRHLSATGWHLSYLIGVTLVAGAAALVRGRRPLPIAVLAVLMAALALTTKLAAG